MINKLCKNKKEVNKSISSQPTIYRKGQKPSWVEEDSDSNDDIFKEEIEEVILKNEKNNEKINNTFNCENVEVLVDRSKLRREVFKSEVINTSTNRENEIVVQNIKNTNNDTVSTVDLSNRRRNIPVIVEKDKKSEENLDAEDELLEMLGVEQEEVIDNDFKNKNLPIQEEEEEEFEEEEIEEEEEEILMRPIFVSKENRATINQQMTKEEEEKEYIENQLKLKEQRKKETKDLVKKIIKDEETKEEEQAEENINDQMPDDTDNLDDIQEYENWKLRELRRIKIQFEEDEKKLNTKLEIERRRNLTDEQRKEENLRLGSDDTLRPFKSKLNFLQKYYHRGVFYQHEAKEDLDHIYNRDYNLPTWEDKIDRSNLPKILQVRRGLQFKKGRSKYTHLTAEDTTNFDPNFKVSDNIMKNFNKGNNIDLGKKRK